MKTVAEILRECVLDTIQINQKQPVVSYLRAKHAIEAAFPNRESKRRAKLEVIKHLGGQKVHVANKPSYVVFPSVKTEKYPEGLRAQF